MKKSINPYNGEALFEFEQHTQSVVNEKIKLACTTFQSWRTTTFQQRSTLMLGVASVLDDKKEAYAQIISQEMGKPVTQAIAEIEKCTWVCEYYAKNAEGQLRPEMVVSDANKSYVRYDPLGTILAVMPWNYPFWQVFRFAAPNLMAGNVGLLKHASNVTQCGELIEGAFRKAGFPDGCFQHLIIDSSEIQAVIENDRVKAVTLTGSMPAGAAVASIAGTQIKKTVLELGGSNALIVFDDADLDSSVKTCVQARFQNTGQSCIAGKRLFLQRGIAIEFTQRFVDEVRDLKIGNPLEKETYIGVMAREDLAEELEQQVKKSVEMGAEIVLGGQRKGTFFAPTVLVNVSSDMPVFKEETFGPVIGITIFDDEQSALDLSNASDFGLGVSVFTTDMDRVERLIPEFNEGAVFVNEMVKSDPRLPFGGVKTSGYGRELSGHGIKEFLNKKTVFIK